MSVLIPTEIGATASAYAGTNAVFAKQTIAQRGGELDWPLSATRISELRIGDAARYRLRNEVLGYTCPAAAGFEFIVEGFEGYFVGQGSSPREAASDWQDRVHAAFQRLIRTRPFEMSESDSLLWTLLQNRINVAEYRASTPLSLRQVGRANYLHSDRPRRICWANGESNDVDLQDMPSRFAGLNPNQWFEAVVTRDPVNGSLLRVLDVEPIPSLRRMTTEEQQTFFASMSVGPYPSDEQDASDG